MQQFKSIFITIALFLLACCCVMIAYHYESKQSWTRDGRVRADVVNLASQVEGKLIKIAVKDNQEVKKGDLLFTIDDQDYCISIARIKANLLSAKYKMERLNKAAIRRKNIPKAISKENIDNSVLDYQQAYADYLAIKQELAQMELNQQRTKIYAPVDGYITNLQIQPGDYVTVGQSLVTLVDKHSFYVYGYFQETQLDNIKIGDQATITLLGPKQTITGHVDSIARGIEDYSNSGTSGKLHDVNPTFEWVRLPMRIPVRIKLDPLKNSNVTLVAGMTCTVSINN